MRDEEADYFQRHTQVHLAMITITSTNCTVSRYQRASLSRSVPNCLPKGRSCSQVSCSGLDSQHEVLA